MAILRPMITPTAGTPQAVVASRRPRNMSQREFYLSSLQQNPQMSQIRQSGSTYQTPQQTLENPVQQEQFEQDPMSGDYISEQLARYSQRTAPPSLEPGARVRSANAELVQPSNFQIYYQQLQSIGQIGDEQTAAASARNMFRAMQAMQTAGGSGGGGGSGGSNKTGGGNAYGGGIPSNPAANFKFAQQVAPQFGWSGKELNAWYTLGMKESGWRNNAQNPTSTAYGIGQFLNSTWAGVGMQKTSDPYSQVLAMAKYIRNRYGSPSRALAFHLRNNWY